MHVASSCLNRSERERLCLSSLHASGGRSRELPEQAQGEPWPAGAEGPDLAGRVRSADKEADVRAKPLWVRAGKATVKAPNRTVDDIRPTVKSDVLTSMQISRPSSNRSACHMRGNGSFDCPCQGSERTPAILLAVEVRGPDGVLQTRTLCVG